MHQIFKRVSVRNFSEKDVEREKIDTLLQAAMAAPTAGNQREWEFIIVTEKPLLLKLAEVSPYAKPLTNAPLGIVLLGNMDNLKWPDYWQQDLGACAQNILLEAVDLDLGGVWLGIAPLTQRMEAVSEIFSLPEQIKPFAIIAIGYPATEVAKKERFDPKKAYYNGYGISKG